MEVGVKRDMKDGAPTYRPDIDGLRAIAVLAVVFYHFGVGGLRGGFVGVDIFFVISGFLITGIISRELSERRFSFARFYERRIRRLFPALFVMLAVVAILAWFVFLPTDLILLGKSTLATVLFSSNIFFWQNSGYFDTSSELNPLLHTWSLAVEEQFYFAFPVFLTVASRVNRKLVVPLVWATVLLTLGMCIALQRYAPAATFYLSPFRAWELGVGALLALRGVSLIESAALREGASWFGLVLVAGSIMLIPAGTGFPGWYATFPVLGTALLLHAGSSGSSVVTRFLSTRPLVLVGLMSYSLYLWHWPVNVLASYLNALNPLGWTIVPLIGLSLLLAAASYRWVEKPFRLVPVGQRLPRQKLFWRTAIVMMSLGVLGFGITLRSGWATRVPAEVVALDRQRTPVIPFLDCEDMAFSGLDSGQATVSCLIGKPGDVPDTLVWGDSHVLAWAPVLDVVMKETGHTGLLAFTSNCPPLIGVSERAKESCTAANMRVLNGLLGAPSIRHVIMVASWVKYTESPGPFSLEDVSEPTQDMQDTVFHRAVVRTMGLLSEESYRIWIIGPTPGAPADAPLVAALRSRFGLKMAPGKSYPVFRDKSSAFYSAVSAVDDVVVLDPAKQLCDSGVCRYMEGRHLLYRDDGHLSIHGALRMQPFLIDRLQLD